MVITADQLIPGMCPTISHLKSLTKAKKKFAQKYTCDGHVQRCARLLVFLCIMTLLYGPELNLRTETAQKGFLSIVERLSIIQII